MSKIPVYFYGGSHYSDHSPLALGMIKAYALSHDHGRLQEHFDFLPILGSKQEVRATFRKHGPGIYLFSDYMWTLNQNIKVSAFVKRLSADSITIHGGPSAPAYADSCQAFFEQHADVDVVVRGEGETTTAELLDALSQHPDRRGLDCLNAVNGITYRSIAGANQLVRSPDRQRSPEPNEFPSPYLTDQFEPSAVAGWTAAIIETNRGCPYGCTFCDWGSATLQKIRQFSLERIRREIEWVGRNQVSVLWIADANFGILKRDVEIAEIIHEVNQKHGFPEQVIVNFAKNATERLAEIIRIFASAGLATQGIISIQTQDPESLRTIHRSNIRTERYEELIGIFRREKLPISSDLMIGLPGTTVASFKKDLQFFFDRQVVAQAYPTVVLPNSPMAHPDYIRDHGIEVDSASRIVSTNSFTKADLRRMQLIYRFYALAYKFSTLKYFLRYLQLDHGVRALDFVEVLVIDYLDWRANPFGTVNGLFRFSLLRELISLAYKRRWRRPMSQGDWTRFYAAVAEYTCRRYGVERSSAMRAVLEIQQALMPSLDRVFPQRIQLPHDAAAYFEQTREVANLQDLGDRTHAYLHTFAPSEFVVTDPSGVCDNPDWTSKFQQDGHMRYWELNSTLSDHLLGTERTLTLQGTS